MARDLLLVGSVPLETPQEVFETCARGIGDLLPAIPDGEVGERSCWIQVLAYRVFHGHPEIETIRRPPPEHGVEKWKPADRSESWGFRVKPGVERVSFGDPGWRLGYAREAINSYFIFSQLRKNGLIPPDVRFQVCLPLTNSAIDFFFQDAADWPRIKPGFEQAMRAEIDKMIEKIPPDDLAMQWDCCVETMDLEDAFPWTPKEGRFERNVAPIANLAPQIPAAVTLGYHLCYGTLGGWPMVESNDLAQTVKFANEAIARSGRRVDFIHVPILNRTDDRYFGPLRDLKAGNARVYLGIIHNMEDEKAFRARLAMAKKYVPEFGLAAPCGFGRHTPGELPKLLGEHRRAVEILRELTKTF
jgi:hypothetical protein